MKIKDQLLFSKKPTRNNFKAFLLYVVDGQENCNNPEFYGATWSKFAILTHHKEKMQKKNYASAIL